MSQQQSDDTVSIDDIPVDIDATQSAKIDPADVPDEIESITHDLASEHPPTNPLVVLKAARWWYIHGKGGTDPAFQWAIEWVSHFISTRLVTSSGSTSSSSTLSQSASLTNLTNSANRQLGFLCACSSSLIRVLGTRIL